MRRALTHIALFDLIFIFILSLSSLFGGAVGETVYYLAFLIPMLFAYLLRKNAGCSVRPLKFSLSGKNTALTLGVLFPTVALIFAISWLTSIVLSFIGEGSVSDVSGNIAAVILKHALLTAILEEILFRYIPLSYISPISKRGAVLFSALFFALVHCNLFQLPYAFFAGVVFALLDIAFDSILPSLVLHFSNNLISIFWIRGSSDGKFVIVYISLLFGLALISAVCVFLMRKDYKKSLTPIFQDKTKFGFPIEVLLFTVMALVIAITNLL